MLFKPKLHSPSDIHKRAHIYTLIRRLIGILAWGVRHLASVGKSCLWSSEVMFLNEFSFHFKPSSASRVQTTAPSVSTIRMKRFVWNVVPAEWRKINKLCGNTAMKRDTVCPATLTAHCREWAHTSSLRNPSKHTEHVTVSHTKTLSFQLHHDGWERLPHWYQDWVKSRFWCCFKSVLRMPESLKMLEFQIFSRSYKSTARILSKVLDTKTKGFLYFVLLPYCSITYCSTILSYIIGYYAILLLDWIYIVFFYSYWPLNALHTKQLAAS